MKKISTLLICASLVAVSVSVIAHDKDSPPEVKMEACNLELPVYEAVNFVAPAIEFLTIDQPIAEVTPIEGDNVFVKNETVPFIEKSDTRYLRYRPGYERDKNTASGKANILSNHLNNITGSSGGLPYWCS